MGVIRADDLEQWASSNAARNKLGVLIRKLIHASVAIGSIRKIHFLSDEANQLPGWDGVLDCDSEVPWIPTGTSVWELGTGIDARAKIREDFKARRERDLPSGWIRGETTYVAVTVRKLDDIHSRERELKEDASLWKDVKIHYSQTLAEWIETCENVQSWLQDQSVGPSSTIHSLEYAWRVWSGTTEPAVSSSLVLADREDVARDLRTNVATLQGVSRYQGDSPDEVVGFIYSTMAGQPDDASQHFLDTAIVISNPDDADRLRQSRPQRVILLPSAIEKAELLARSGHTVIGALGNSAGPKGIYRRLQRATPDQFKEALVEMGLTEERAEIEARVCGRSPSIWRVWNLRQRGNLSSEIPKWAKAENLDLVVPAVLLCGWSKVFEGDRDVIARVTGQEFTAYTDKIHPFISQDHPLLTKVGDAWVVTAPATAFALIDDLVSPGQIEKLREIVLDVFSQLDPTIDLPPDERPYAAMRVGGMKHSTWLRDGLAETLLRIVVIGERLEETGAIPSPGRKDFVDSLIRQLPGLDQDWRLLASLRDQLPVLAEAAPYPFLESLERLLQGPPEKILPIFDEGDSTFGHTFHPALWWALETLAWEPKYLGRVCLVLAKFAKIDPSGRITNRPINSLRSIFLAWLPGTNADLTQRLQALDAILEREPEVGWTLLLSLMPQSHDHTSPTRQPLWKEFSRSQRGTLTRGKVLQAYEQYIDRAIAHAGKNSHRCSQLVQFYDDVAETHREAIERSLRALAASELPEGERDAVWNILRAFINRHRQFADAAWALPSNQLQRLDEIQDLFVPTDPITRFAWLFNAQLPDLPFSSTNFAELDVERDRLRKEAVEEIWRAGGIDLVMDLVENVAYPGFVSPRLVEVLPSAAEVLQVVEKSSRGSANQRFFARCVAGDAYQRFGDEWTNLITSASSADRWSPETIGNVFVNYPDSLETYDLVSGLGRDVEREYWRTKRWFYHGADTETIQRTVDNLMVVGRALDVVQLSTNQLAVLGPQWILTILDQCLVEMNAGAAHLQEAVYWIEELFEWLRQRDDVERNELARREYAFLPLLTRGRATRSLALHEVLSVDPKFFVHVICDLYKPASREKQPLSDEGSRRAEFAWELLRSWRRPPGVHDATQVNANELVDWITRARLLAAEADRKIVADQHIGNVLFYYPPDPTDSAWPHVEIRRLLEELASDDIESGIEMAQFNSRGVVMKGLQEGGVQERSIAVMWRERARVVGPLWQRTTSMLERIAESWERLAAHEDERAEKDRLRSD